MVSNASESRTLWPARAAGNVLVGIAIGLLSYYLMSDVVADFQQRSLAAAFSSVDQPALIASSSAPLFDMSDWEAQDQRYWDGLKEGQPFARIAATSIGLDKVVVKGVTRADLAKGPGWITTTQLPGTRGNCGISGHRTTFGAPFRHLDRLKRGDTITLSSPYRVYTYRVQKIFTVTPDRVDVVGPTPVPSLTLTACHPPFSARLRLIVRARLTGVTKK